MYQYGLGQRLHFVGLTPLLIYMQEKIFQDLDDKNPNLYVFHEIYISNNGVIVEAQFEESLRK